MNQLYKINGCNTSVRPSFNLNLAALFQEGIEENNNYEHNQNLIKPDLMNFEDKYANSICYDKTYNFNTVSNKLRAPRREPIMEKQLVYTK